MPAPLRGDRDRNPYYAMLPQPTLDPHDWYAPGLDFPYVSPNTLAVVLNYRHGKFAFTPAMQLHEGTTYGTPADVQGTRSSRLQANQGSHSHPDERAAQCRLHFVLVCADERRHQPR